MTFKRIAQTSITVLLVSVLTACSSISALDKVVKDNRAKYQKATVLPPLAVPPDLSTERINDEFAETNNDEPYIEFDGAADNPLTQKYNVEPSTKPALMGEGQNRYLVVYGEDRILWQRMLDFWANNNIAIKRQDQGLGLLDTDVDEDGYAYRSYTEQGDRPNSLKIYITAAGFDSDDKKNEAKLRQLAEHMGKLYLADNNISSPAQQQISTQRPTTANRITTQTVSRPATPTVIDAVIIDEASEHQALMVDLPLDDVWRRVGRILNSKYFVVQDRERDKGVYFVQYLDPFLLAKTKERSLMSKMAFWQDEQDYAPDLFYYIKIVTDDGQSKVIIKDIDQIRTSSPSARRLLRLLQEKMAY